ncbi:hypothetical protein TNCV_2838001 [Trichonephila clavipes]|nr:hypothetical protein TNCV_2838001 [Trichonephila clavipes]
MEGRNVARPARQVELLYDRWQHHPSPLPQFRSTHLLLHGVITYGQWVSSLHHPRDLFEGIKDSDHTKIPY